MEHGGGGPLVGEVTRLGGVTRLSIYLPFQFDNVDMIGGVTRRELPNLPGVSTSMSTGPWRYKYNESIVSG